MCECMLRARNLLGLIALLVSHFTPLCNFGPLSKEITKNVPNVYTRQHFQFSIQFHPNFNSFHILKKTKIKTQNLYQLFIIFNHLHPFFIIFKQNFQKTKTPKTQSALPPANNAILQSSTSPAPSMAVTSFHNAVILTPPGMGHIIPSLELAKRLVTHQIVPKVTIFLASIKTSVPSKAETQLLQSATNENLFQILFTSIQIY